MTINFAHITSNETLDFYIAKIPAGWFTFACVKGSNPNDPEGRRMGGFTAKKDAVAACHHWAVWMK